MPKTKTAASPYGPAIEDQETSVAPACTDHDHASLFEPLEEFMSMCFSSKVYCGALDSHEVHKYIIATDTCEEPDWYRRIDNQTNRMVRFRQFRDNRDARIALVWITSKERDVARGVFLLAP